MRHDKPGKDETHAVVRDREGRHALWPVWRPVPTGWQAVAVTGSAAHCLAYVEATWADLRPSSDREAAR
ncbi:MbtH protein [Azorhizobium sp. AG788]|uniref:MbtH family protein n=1 Tax=Azorhizobium sp. AG788 TaxID=2183897 RepID=UPI00106075EB|nr:MbtH family NRPS accessory protein [Azorhizobium sp. AG788]TDT93700.1 MbtH protein [Azorhizobium sp. AG788]